MDAVRRLLGLNAGKDSDAIIERLMLSLPAFDRPSGSTCRCPDCGRTYTDYDDEPYSLDPSYGRPPPLRLIDDYRTSLYRDRADTRDGLKASYGTLLEPAVPKDPATKGRSQKGQRFRAQSLDDKVVVEKERVEVKTETSSSIDSLKQTAKPKETDRIDQPAKPNSTDRTPQNEPKLQSTTFFCGPSASTATDKDKSCSRHRRTKTKLKTRPETSQAASPSPSHQNSSDAVPATSPTPSPPPTTIVHLTSQIHKDLFLRMFGALFTARTTTPFTDFVAAMVDAGFTAQHSAGGSAVTFKDHKHRYGGGSIGFHRPHPDPRVDYPKLRTWGKRLGMQFGFGEGSFVVREGGGGGGED